MAKPGYIDLINAALVSIGQEPITSLDNAIDVSPVVTAVKTKVDIVKRKLLRCNDWNCARITTPLNQIANPTNTRGWKYVYQLPHSPECLRVVQISVNKGETFIDLDDYYNRNAGPREALFDLDGEFLLSNIEDVWIKYTADIDAARFDASLASAFVAQLAAELAYTLPASVSLADYMNKLAKQELKAAKSLNARERNIIRPEGEVIGIRYGSWEFEKHLRVDMSDELEENQWSC